MGAELASSKLQVEVAAGDGLIGATGNFIVRATGDALALATLQQQLGSVLADGSWVNAVRGLAVTIGERGFDEHPSVLCLSIEPDLVRAFVFGDLEVEIETSDEQRTVNGAGTSTWAEAVVDGGYRRLTSGRSPGPDELVGRLEEGFVAGSGFYCQSESWQWATVAIDLDTPFPFHEPHAPIVGRGAHPTVTSERTSPSASTADDVPSQPSPSQPEPPPAPPSQPEPPPSPPSQPLLLQPPLASEEGDGATGHAGPPPLAPGPAQVPEAIPAQGPRVTGVLCPDEHLCSLRDQHCRTCGQPIDAGTELVSGPRPALGILVFDDGETVDLEVPVVVGREVPADYEVDGQQPRIVNMIEEGEPTVSRVHLEIRLDDWTVNMVDQISSNGTFIRAGAATHHRTRIPAGHATPIDIGTYVEVGERWFLFTTRAEL